jgi:non-ribosomal peptide synthetase component F
MHHMVSDEWSTGVFWREMAALYSAYSSGATSPLPELPIQYADFAYWQWQQPQDEMLKNQLAYWKSKLSGELPDLQLPTDRPRPAMQTFRGTKQFFMLPRGLSESLNALSRREHVTLFMTLLAAFNTLLYRYSGQEDILVGSPVANCTQVETEELIGCFLNTLVLRTDLSGNPRFLDLLGRAREVVMGALTHQGLPFERLVEELQPRRDLSRNPLFQVMFVLQNTPPHSPELADLMLSVQGIDSETALFDLTVSLWEKPEGLSGWFEYNTDLFDIATIVRMIGHFQTLLEHIVTNPEQRIAELPLLTVAERQQLLIEWNDVQADYSTDLCVHQLWEAQVERTPDSVAVVFENEQLTYRELNRRANQLAHYLCKLGVGPETLVGLCVERSVELIIGILGVLKAGGAYVPLDPNYPRERLAFMLDDSAVSVLLTQAGLLTEIPETRIQVVRLDTDWAVISGEDVVNPVSGVIRVAPQLTVVTLPLPLLVAVSAWVDVLGAWVRSKGAGGP